MHKQTTIFFCLLLGTTSVHSENKRAHAHFHLAHVMNSEGETQGALEHYKKALTFEQNHAGALFQLGCLLYQSGNIDEALQIFQKRKTVLPSCAQTERGLARCWTKKNNPENAIDHYRRAIELKPQDEVTLCEFAALLVQQKNFEAAATIYRRILQLNPERNDIFVQLAEALSATHCNQEALTCYEQLAIAYADDPQLLMRKARILTLLDRTDEALELYNRVLELVPDNPKILHNIAHIHRSLGNCAQAKALYQRTLALEPNNKRALLGFARTLLYEGKNLEGWYALDIINRRDYHGSLYLTSLDDIAGKTVLIGGDWFHENMIQFIRYAQQLKKCGAHVAVQTPQALTPLLSQCPYIDDLVIMEQDQSYHHHHYISITSLPHLLGTDKTTITTDGPYLRADPQLVQKWHEKLFSENKLNVGMYVQPGHNSLCAELIQLGQLDTIQLYLLHNQDTTVDLSDVLGNQVVHIICNAYKKDNETFAHLAAIVKNLDLVITQDATLAHLAGALHIPVWVLLPRVANWRWQTTREDCPWYPTMRLFRQTKDGAWADVVQIVRKELGKKSNRVF